MSLDLSTRYLGLHLTSPVVIGSCPIADHPDSVARFAEAGAGAVVMRSLFEEQTIHPDPARSAAAIESYLDQVRALKRAVAIPIIASINAGHSGNWLSVVPRIVEAGADALELNLFRLSADPAETAERAEERIIRLVSEAKHAAGPLPVAVKLSPFFSALPNLAHRLELAGASGLVLFNRIYQSDIDIESLRMTPKIRLSDSSDLPLRLRWVSILATTYPGTLVCCGGVHTTTDTIQALLSGAHAVQIVSAAMKRGPAACGEIITGLGGWMYRLGFENLDQVRDAMNPARAAANAAGVRAQHVRTLRSFDPWQGTL